MFIASMGLNTTRFAANLRTVLKTGRLVLRSNRITDRSAAVAPMMEVSTWLKQTSVIVSVKFGHWIFWGAVLVSRSQTLIHPAPEEAAKELPDRWQVSAVYGPPSCHVDIGSESLGELYGSHSLMPSVAQVKSLLSFVKVMPLTIFECAAVRHDSSREVRSHTLTTPSPEPEATELRELLFLHMLYTP